MFFRLILIIEHDLSPLLQLIQTISATDTDEPLVGHKFIFSLSSSNPNFTIFDNEGKLCFTSSTFSCYNNEGNNTPLNNLFHKMFTYSLNSLSKVILG